MTIHTEDFTATLTGWTTVRGSVPLERVTTDNSGSIRSSTNGNARRDASVGNADMFTEVDVVAAGADADRSIFVMTRCGTGTGNSAQTYYAALLNAGRSELTLLRYVNAAAAPLVANLSVSIPSTPFRYRLESEGSTHRVIIGDTEVGEWSDSAVPDSAYGGVGFYNAGTGTTPLARIDNFRTGALADETAGPPPGQFLPFFGR